MSEVLALNGSTKRSRGATFLRETGVYLGLMGFCIGVVLLAPYFLREKGEAPDPAPRVSRAREENPIVNRPVNDRGDTALHLAVREGNTGRIVDLLKQNADPSTANQEGVTPLDLAHARGQEDIIGLLTGGRFRDTLPVGDGE